MATLKELSEYTGFSITTISRVLNNDPTMKVTDATRAAILEAAGKLQYKASPRARRAHPESASPSCTLPSPKCSPPPSSWATPITSI